MNEVSSIAKPERNWTEEATDAKGGSPRRAYKRSPASANSTWYKGIPVSQMAGTADNDGAFDLVISKVRRGTEPPPHLHSREDETFYILSGQMNFYVDGEVFAVTSGEYMFLPSGVPHAFLLTSEDVHTTTLLTPGGFLDARMDVPTDVDLVTHANVDLTKTLKVFEQYGVRLLAPDEIRTLMSTYPLDPRP